MINYVARNYVVVLLAGTEQFAISNAIVHRPSSVVSSVDDTPLLLMQGAPQTLERLILPSSFLLPSSTLLAVLVLGRNSYLSVQDTFSL